jgi:probable phosphoglycerate mutase
MSRTTNKPTPLCSYLIRHGETEWSLSGQHTGATDIPLTSRGEEEARELGQRLRGIRFAHVLVSPRLRARRTCELAGLGAAAEVAPELAEWDYGDYEGQRSVDIRKVRPDWNIFRDGCPGGETPTQVSNRADLLIARLRALNENVALFSHGQYGCVLAARWIGLPLVEAKHFQLGTASISILGYDHHHPDVSVIAQWNAVSDEKPYAMPVNQRAIQRWENEGGEIPSNDGANPGQPHQALSTKVSVL